MILWPQYAECLQYVGAVRVQTLYQMWAKSNNSRLRLNKRISFENLPFVLERGHFGLIFQLPVVAHPSNHSSYRERIKHKVWAEVSLVLSQFARLSYGRRDRYCQTNRQTDIFLMAIAALHSIQRCEIMFLKGAWSRRKLMAKMTTANRNTASWSWTEMLCGKHHCTDLIAFIVVQTCSSLIGQLAHWWIRRTSTLGETPTLLVSWVSTSGDWATGLFWSASAVMTQAFTWPRLKPHWPNWELMYLMYKAAERGRLWRLKATRPRLFLTRNSLQHQLSCGTQSSPSPPPWQVRWAIHCYSMIFAAGVDCLFSSKVDNPFRHCPQYTG